MTDTLLPTFTAFQGHNRVAAGPLQEIALAVKRSTDAREIQPILIYDDVTGRALDIDTRGTEDEIRARFAMPTPAERGRGRPKLGVVAREVTLLPRHWDWLSAQRGGASVALRKLVDDARHAGSVKDRRRAAQDAAYHFMSSIAGDLPGYEEALRALYADDREKFAALTDAWPTDIRDHAHKLTSVD